MPRSLLLRLIASVQPPPLTSRPLSLFSPSFPPQHSIWVLFTTATPSLPLHLPPKTSPLANWGRGVCNSRCRSGKPAVKFAWLLPLLLLPLICTRATCMLSGRRQNIIISKRKVRHDRAARRCACTGGEQTSKRIVLNVFLVCFVFISNWSFRLRSFLSRNGLVQGTAPPSIPCRLAIPPRSNWQCKWRALHGKGCRGAKKLLVCARPIISRTNTHRCRMYVHLCARPDPISGVLVITDADTREVRFS